MPSKKKCSKSGKDLQKNKTSVAGKSLGKCKKKTIKVSKSNMEKAKLMAKKTKTIKVSKSNMEKAKLMAKNAKKMTKGRKRGIAISKERQKQKAIDAEILAGPERDYPEYLITPRQSRFSSKHSRAEKVLNIKRKIAIPYYSSKWGGGHELNGILFDERFINGGKHRDMRGQTEAERMLLVRREKEAGRGNHHLDKWYFGIN